MTMIQCAHFTSYTCMHLQSVEVEKSLKWQCVDLDHDALIVLLLVVTGGTLFQDRSNTKLIETRSWRSWSHGHGFWKY